MKREPATGTTFSLDAHPLVRDYFASGMKDSAAWRKAHGRLFDHLCKVIEYQPATLAGLQPLYQAIAHGCLADRQQEAVKNVYRDRILRGNEAYSMKKLGAFGPDLGALASFFDRPWSRVSQAFTEPEQAWVLHEGAFALRSLGRLTEAIEPLETSVKMAVRLCDWCGAAAGTSNRSQVELLLGRVSDALQFAEQSVTFADRSRDELQRISKRTTHADALHQSGRRSDAMAIFREAEALQAAWQSNYSVLYSLQGILYCDLLLAGAERAAWQRMLAHGSETGNPFASALLDVEQRTMKTLAWATAEHWLLSIALDHLTLSRAGLYRTILTSVEFGLQPAISSNVAQRARGVSGRVLEHLPAALDGLRDARTVDYLPRGLLTRAWHLFLSGDRAGAPADLAEAWEIAERGPMPLFQVDIPFDARPAFLPRGGLSVGKPAAGSGGSETAD